MHRTYVVTACKAGQHPIQTVSRAYHIRGFFCGDVAGVVGVMWLQYPDSIWAVFICAALDPAKRSIGMHRSYASFVSEFLFPLPFQPTPCRDPDKLGSGPTSSTGIIGICKDPSFISLPPDGDYQSVCPQSKR